MRNTNYAKMCTAQKCLRSQYLKEGCLAILVIFILKEGVLFTSPIFLKKTEIPVSLHAPGFHVNVKLFNQKQYATFH